MRFCISQFEGKETYLRQALYAAGHTEAERVDETDLLLVDTDAPWAHPRPAMIQAAHEAGAKVAVYPHGGMPCCWMYDGICDPDERVDMRLEHGPGSIEVARLLGLDLAQHATGWLYSPTRPFEPVEQPKRMLFAPLHPIIEGLAGPMNGHDPAPLLNQRVYKRLLELDYELTVSVVGPPHRSGIWPHPRARFEHNQGMSFTRSFELIAAADVVVAAGTVAAAAIACGKPTIMYAQDNFQDFVEGAYPQAAHPELYRDLIRYPLDADTDDLGALILQACVGDAAAAEWRERFVGNDGADAAVRLLEQLIGDNTEPAHVMVGGVTARATGGGG